MLTSHTNCMVANVRGGGGDVSSKQSTETVCSSVVLRMLLVWQNDIERTWYIGDHSEGHCHTVVHSSREVLRVPHMTGNLGHVWYAPLSWDWEGVVTHRTQDLGGGREGREGRRRGRGKEGRRRGREGRRRGREGRRRGRGKGGEKERKGGGRGEGEEGGGRGEGEEGGREGRRRGRGREGRRRGRGREGRRRGRGEGGEKERRGEGEGKGQ